MLGLISAPGPIARGQVNQKEGNLISRKKDRRGVRKVRSAMQVQLTRRFPDLESKERGANAGHEGSHGLGVRHRGGAGVGGGGRRDLVGASARGGASADHGGTRAGGGARGGDRAHDQGDERSRRRGLGGGVGEGAGRKKDGAGRGEGSGQCRSDGQSAGGCSRDCDKERQEKGEELHVCELTRNDCFGVCVGVVKLTDKSSECDRACLKNGRPKRPDVKQVLG